MQYLVALASLLAVAQATTITAPKAGTNVQPGQKVVVQLTEPINTSAYAGTAEVSIVIGIAPCGSTGCPAPSANLGALLYIGKYTSQGQVGNTLTTFQNITVEIPQGIKSGPATIQVQHNALLSLPDFASTPQALEYTSLAVTIGSGGGPPPANTVVIHPSSFSNKCVDVKGAVYANGTPVDIYDCNGTAAQKWQFSNGALVITNPADQSKWCLDAGVQSTWANGLKMKIWQCFSDLAQQKWSAVGGTAGAIRLNGGNFCLDLTEGSQTNFNPLQIWTCSSGNPNQAWIAAA